MGGSKELMLILSFRIRSATSKRKAANVIGTMELIGEKVKM
jgi:hypothetical protein